LIKFVITPVNLTQLLNHALPTKALVSCPIKFTPLSAKINFLSPSGKLLILADYTESGCYFIDYEANDDYFVFYQKLIKELKNGFRQSEKVTLWTDKQFVRIDGEAKDDKITMPITPFEDEMKVSPFQSIMTDQGLMPTKDGKVLSFNVHCLISVYLLFKNLPKSRGSSDEFVFSWDGSELTLFVKTESVLRKRPLTPKKYVVQGEPLDAYFSMSLVQDLAKQFGGEVWLGIFEGGMVFSQTNSEYNLTYMLSAEKVEDGI
jgi:hypothetical protein